tara:strand:- start:1508 stop:3010 length:1503 start_codon:yes stop_codon:yes gene_type:complete
MKIISDKNLQSKLKIFSNKTVVHCHGVFDLLHYGHIQYLENAKKLGSILFVSITSDKYVNKGFNRPYFNENIRAKAISALSFVDYVYINNYSTSENIIKKLKPNFYVKGIDYKKVQNIDKNLLKEKKALVSIGGKMIFGLGKIYSSSKIINKEYDVFNNKQSVYIKKIKQKYSFNKIIDILDKLQDLKILTIGETIIDEYIFSDAVGKSGKEPILVNKKIKSEKYAGGIISVANNLSTFSNKIKLISFIGSKNQELNFLKKNINNNIEYKFIKKNNSPTILKSRLVDNYTKSKIMGIYDINDEPLTKVDEKNFSNILSKNIKKFDLVLVIDYGHGIISSKIAKLIKNKSKYFSLNAQLNSLNYNSYNLGKYKSADYLCIHQGELQNHFKTNSDNTKFLMKKLKNEMKLDNLSITLGKEGIINLKNSKFITCPAFANKVVDRVGAGDSMIGITSLLFALGVDTNLTLLIGSVMAGKSIANLGTGKLISKQEILKDIDYILK